MKHWSASISYECCSVGKTSAPSACGVVKSCPISNGFADLPDTSSSKTLTPPNTPDAFCKDEHNPTVFSGAHRKTPASAEHREAGYMLQEVVSDGLFGSRFVRVEDVSPEGRTRRRILSGHWMRTGLHICGLVFFRLKPRIIAFFPRFGASKFDLLFSQDGSEGFHADRGKHLFLDQVIRQLRQRPAGKRLPQQLQRGNFWRVDGQPGDVIVTVLSVPIYVHKLTTQTLPGTMSVKKVFASGVRIWPNVCPSRASIYAAVL